MKRRPPASDEEAKETPAPPATDAPPSWPASAASEKVEVALFIIPGPAKPWSSVVDVRHASRIQIAGFESPEIAIEPNPAASSPAAPVGSPFVERRDDPADAAADELVLNAEATRPASATVPDLALFADDSGNALEAFPSESREAASRELADEVVPDAHTPAVAPPRATSPWADSGARAFATANQNLARLWSKAASQFATLRSGCAAVGARMLNAAASRFNEEARAAARQSTAAAGTALVRVAAGAWSTAARSLSAAHSAVLAPAIRRLKTDQPWSRAKSQATAGRSAVAAWLRAAPGPVIWKARAGCLQSSWKAQAVHLQSRAASRVSEWQSAVAAMPGPRRRQVGLGMAAAAAVLLAVGVARVAQLTLAPPEPVGQLTDAATLSVRPLEVVASLAPSLARSAAGFERAAPSELDGRAEPSAPPATAPAVVAPSPRSSSERELTQQRPVSAPPVAEVTQRPPLGNSSAGASTAPPPVPAEIVPADSIPTPATSRQDDVARADAPSTPPDTAGEALSRASLPPPAADVMPPADRVVPAADLSASDGIAETLKHLQLAYERRDATLAKEVWPTVDERALARAFDGLRSQSVTFDRCQLNVSGAAGEVECRGVTRYVPRVGGQYQRIESRQWKFRVQKGADSWLITSAAAR